MKNKYCVKCGSRLGIDCGEAEPDYNENYCSKGCFETIDFTKDSEYIRLFDDDDTPEEFMESVYRKELGSSFEKMENGVSIGHYEEED